MEMNNVDMNLSQEILNNYNAGKYDHYAPIRAGGIPGIDNRTILDMNAEGWSLDAETVLMRAEIFNVPKEMLKPDTRCKDSLFLSAADLASVGKFLFPLFSPGVLNGGSATSYLDRKKNRSFNENLYDLYADVFEAAAEKDGGKPKGIVPAYINPDGSPGFSFMELRLRNLLIEHLRSTGNTLPLKPLSPLFQMTSIQTHEDLQKAYRAYKDSPALAPLIQAGGLDILDVETGVQPLITAYTHSREGRPKRIFTNAWGKEGTLLPLPGGHGQNFRVLKEVYTKLYQSGKRFVSLGNVDNLGYTPHPIELALLCLSGRNAGFEFSFRTPVDVKGGILLLDQHGKLNCGDIGVAVTREEVELQEKSGTPILFNCASGLFDLEFLVNSLDHIIENLPVRFSDQEKDAGAYSQAEQVTWEVIGMIDKPLIFSVNKYDRFLASKLYIENLMTSGFRLNDPRFPSSGRSGEDIRSLAVRLYKGFTRKMREAYGMKYTEEAWQPLTPEELLDTSERGKEGSL